MTSFVAWGFGGWASCQGCLLELFVLFFEKEWRIFLWVWSSTMKKPICCWAWWCMPQMQPSGGGNRRVVSSSLGCIKTPSLSLPPSLPRHNFNIAQEWSWELNPLAVYQWEILHIRTKLEIFSLFVLRQHKANKQKILHIAQAGLELVM